ncbi:MAG: YitT family protein [Tissierellia bacterium]|nr:YitT family protein [Tissierellia bacterium]
MKKTIVEMVGTKEEFRVKILATIFGITFISIAINMFYLPAGLLSGGVSGISMLLEYNIGVPTGITMLVFNIPLLLLAYLKLNKQFTFYTIVSTFLFTFVLMLTRPLQGILNLDDRLLSAVFGGVINGIGGGILFRFGTSSGGFDILASYMKKYYNINISSVLMTLNGVILSISAMLFGLERSLYTIIALFIGYRIMDRIQLGFGEKKQILIMSRYYEEIANEIIDNIDKGVTYLHGEGAYSNSELKIIYTVVNTRQIVMIKDIIKKYDNSAFMSISEVSEVKGRGFKTYNI